MNKLFEFIKSKKIEITIFILALCFSTWLMFSSFNIQQGNMQISAKSWSDFASHIPLIRSFSLGDNLPPQYPLFSGPTIKYHFLFYLIVGLLEKAGIRIDFALNIPSIIGFTFLILMIYIFAKEIFKSRAVGILSIFLFLFNSSLSFITFFQKHSFSIQEIIANKSFTNFGPYDGGVISAFWNLNIYTNQRHLAASYALSLFIIYIFLKLHPANHKRAYDKTLAIGIILGISFILNMAVFLMTISVLTCLLLFLKHQRKYIFISLLISGVIALPFYLYQTLTPSTSSIMITPGYLVTKLNLINFINYWWQNIGFNLILIPIAFLISQKINKKIFIAFLCLFIIGNIFKFSPEIAANHKFFNFFIIIGGMYSANLLVILWKKHLTLKPLTIILFFLLILSGIIDFFPIYNDRTITLEDYTNNSSIRWIKENTQKNSVFLNSQYLYNYANLAGRKVFLGWPYFAWSQGYNTEARDNVRKQLLNTNDLDYFCSKSINFKLNYVDINLKNTDAVVNLNFFEKNFKKVFENKEDSFIIYSINSRC